MALRFWCRTIPLSLVRALSCRGVRGAPPPSGLLQRVLVLYLPPGSQLPLLHDLTAWALAHPCPPDVSSTIVMGDLNIDPARGRTEADRALVAALTDLETALGIRSIPFPGPTRIAGIQEATLDYAAVSSSSSWA